jgi:competence ComEA-like helix-hairpin-helix protein
VPVDDAAAVRGRRQDVMASFEKLGPAGRPAVWRWAFGATAALWVAALFTVSAAGKGSTTTGLAVRPVQPVQDDRAAKAFEKVCHDCHEPDRIVETKRTRGGWEEIVEKMIEKGATGTDQDFDLVLVFLLGHYGMVNVNQASPEDIALVIGLSAKEGEAIVAYRRANGNFKNFDGLAKVPDIDQKKIDAHKDQMIF